MSPARSKATDQQLTEAYSELKSVWKVADRFSMCGQSVHERLKKLGVTVPVNVFTADEEKLLRREYAIYRDAGKLDELAERMNRTKPFLCRKAGEMGLTDKNVRRTWLAVWKYISEEAAEVIWEDFKKSSLGLKRYCLNRGYDSLGFSRAMQEHFADEYEHVIELKQPKTGKYKRGRSFEYTTRDHLKKNGYFVMRSPASRSPVDLVAIAPSVVLLVQCKLSGSLPPGEWNELFDLASSVGAIPVMAERHKSGRGVSYWLMTERKDGTKRRQPMVEFCPAQAKQPADETVRLRRQEQR